MKKITIVIVSYNVLDYLVPCIDSVHKATERIDAEIVVVDNCSKDDTVNYLREHYPDVRLIPNKENVGFSRANNQAIRASASEYVLLLNPDTFVYENTISSCVDFMDAHPQAGGVGVRMLTHDGNPAPESRRAIPTPWVAMLKMLGFSHRYYMSDLPWDEPCQIEVVSGAYCMLRRKALDQIGLLDEDYFMYGEDIDLSYRMIHGGWQNWFLFPLCSCVLSGNAYLLPEALQPFEFPALVTHPGSDLFPGAVGIVADDGKTVAAICESS